MKTWNWRKVLWAPTSWSLLLGWGGWWGAAAHLGAERRSSEASASLACWQHICPGTPGLGSVGLLPLPKRNRKTHSSQPSQPFGILQSQARKRWTAEKYPCWFWNVFCDVESWSIKSHHVSPNFINSGLSFFGWIFLSFKPQSSVLRNTDLGSAKEHCARLNRWFWQDNPGCESSFPACRLSHDQQDCSTVPISCHRASAAPCSHCSCSSSAGNGCSGVRFTPSPGTCFSS